MVAYSIQLKNVSFRYSSKEVFRDLNLFVPLKKNVTIMSSSNGGKTTLLKLLGGELKGTGEIVISQIDQVLENSSYIQKVFLVVFDELFFLRTTVFEELAFGLENSILNPKKLNETIFREAKEFGILTILDNEFSTLTLQEKYYVKIISYLIMNPKMIVFDGVLSYLPSKYQKKILEYMSKKGIYFVNVTSVSEESLWTDYLFVLYQGNVAIEGIPTMVWKEEKLMRRMGFNLPFYIDLSIQLGYYGLIHSLYLNKEDLEGALWK